MRSIPFIILPFWISITLAVFSGCSDDDTEPGCYQDQNRKVEITIQDVTGTIKGSESHSCSNDYIIDLDEKVNGYPLGLLSPCNLAEAYKVDGQRITFSGNVYESFETEDICADFFELTDIGKDTE